MITKIKVHNIATYEDIVEIKPKVINYFFGSNGTGKSTLGKVIADISACPSCEIHWSTSPIDIFIYNKEFIQNNFLKSNMIKGIFTLGKDAADIQSFIEDANNKIDKINKQIEGLNKTREKKEKELSSEQERLEKKAWELKKKYEEFFRPAFKGFMRSAKDFCDKCLNEQKNKSDLLAESEIIEKSKKIFGNDLKYYEPIDKFTFDDLSKYENSEILKTKIVGKEDIEIGKLIQELNNSDWIHEGIVYLQQTKNICPFCQQHISNALREKIESFFGETYKIKMQELDDFVIGYKRYIEGLILKLRSIITKDISTINFEELENKLIVVQEIYKNNINKLEEKQKKPSMPIEIESLKEKFLEISELIEKIKKEIEENNKIYKNINEEKNDLKSKIWRFVVNELKIDLESFNKIKLDVEKALKSIGNNLKKAQEEKSKLEKEIAEKESEVTSVKPTVNEINKILNLFGFTNFMLDEADKKGFYKVVRSDGGEAKETLSEGETTFLTFLYFYHMIKGSINNIRIGKDKIVVIDDPISSLDSNVLFIVSNLTKDLIRDVKKGTNGMKQIFILTHNVYFFKEVTFKGRGNNKWKEEAYWIIRKLNNKTQIKEYEENPIKTSYELLWRELDDINQTNSITIFNTLRRILEYYFNILGGLDYEGAINKFEGEEKIICKSLISWVNDGSHFINDDLIVDAEPEIIEKYLNVFKLIFERMGHCNHYNMMMRLEN